MVVLLRGLAKLRPTGEPRAYLSVATQLVRLWPIYLEAMTTADPAKAQELARRGQSVLDGSTEQLGILRTVSEAAAVLSNIRVEPAIAERAFKALSILHPGMDLPGLIAIGTERGRALSGGHVATGSAVDLLIVDLVGKAYLDPDALGSKLRELSQLGRHELKVRQVARLTGAVDDLGVARRDVFECLLHFERIVGEESDPTVIFRRLSKTVGELYEAALPLLVWSRLLSVEIEGIEHYQRLIKKDATHHVERLAAAMPTTFVDAPSFLRHSAHHGRCINIDPAAETISIDLRSFSATFSAPEYIDKAYAFLESVLALNWTISNALERCGVDVPLPPGAAAHMGLTQEKLAAFWLHRSKGIEVIESVRRNGHWRIEATFGEQDILVAALGFATLADPACDSVTVVTAGSSTPPITLALSDYQDYAERSTNATSEDSVLGLIELLHRMTQSNTCLLREDDLEFAVVYLAFAVTSGDLAQVPRLRRLRQIALQHDYTPLGDLAVRALATIRSGDDSELKRELAGRTQSFAAPSLPSAASVEIRLRDRSPFASRGCD
ncbi:MULTISPECIES: hypothetical protein [unclassified Microbacterium]|uniref:hypothetical protein n=1 Tax=unclassified Microbacterium TaxID=2609290 RepID=UPI00214BDC32|nr:MULTISPECIES: hypothetical protein [unclassified Microbacterium]MCR2811293.1 hypothetical protein [Microbacterium sp. zg.B185]WIM19450.1 hypothetical protein QNO12_01175 [Microbacterium sp. zg-B185]